MILLGIQNLGMNSLKILSAAVVPDLLHVGNACANLYIYILITTNARFEIIKVNGDQVKVKSIYNWLKLVLLWVPVMFFVSNNYMTDD